MIWIKLFNVIIILLSLIGVIYFRIKSNKLCSNIKEDKVFLIHKAIMDGIFIIEFLFLISIHAEYVNDFKDNSVHLTCYLYYFAENIKSIYFLLSVMWSISWLKRKLQTARGSNKDGQY